MFHILKEKKIKTLVEVLIVTYFIVFLLPKSLLKVYFYTLNIIFKKYPPVFLKDLANVWVGLYIIMVLLLFFIVQRFDNYKIKLNEFKVSKFAILESFSLCLFTFGFSISIFYMMKHRGIVPFNGTSTEMIYKTIFDVILGPIVEELLFRKILVNKLKNAYPPFMIIFIVGTLFALCHGKSRYLNMILSGNSFLFVYVYLKYNSIFLNILCHSLYNFLVVIVLTSSFYYNFIFSQNYDFIMTISFFVFLMVILITIIYIFYISFLNQINRLKVILKLRDNIEKSQDYP